MAVTELCAHAFSTEQQLTEEQIYNQKPQAQYNEKQTRSFWRKVKDNLPVLGAMIAASVAIVTMSFNNHTTLRHQQDTESEANEIVEFQFGGVVCIERRDREEWKIAWMITPALLHS
jgi:uncharacterized Rmd1/YagE family protein